tara:strand:+ start:260 stop:1240 length:981 start_codon:yes stop_codon:yes gene_type:complete
MLPVLWIAGCDWSSNPVDAGFSTYLQRIAYTQEESAAKLSANENIVLPDQRKLITNIPSVSIGLLDSYELRKCDLFHLIAEKNSILGKVQDPFRNYDYQTELVIGLKKCIVNDAISTELKSRLRGLLEVKQAQLHLHFSNLVFTSDAMRAQFSGYEWIDTELKVVHSPIKQALDNLNTNFAFSRQLNPTTQHTALTPFQETLEKQSTIGALSYSMLNASIKLDQVTHQLMKFDSKVICGPQRDLTRFRTLRNVFSVYYIDQLQPYLANIDGLFLQVEPYLEFTQSSHLEYSHPILELHERFRKSIANHVGYWQKLFKRCNASPTRN